MIQARYVTRTDNTRWWGCGVWWLMDAEYRLLGWLTDLPSGDVVLEVTHGGKRNIVDFNVDAVQVVKRYGALVGYKGTR